MEKYKKWTDPSTGVNPFVPFVNKTRPILSIFIGFFLSFFKFAFFIVVFLTFFIFTLILNIVSFKVYNE